MHLLYADESGSTNDPKQQHFVLAGLSVFERQGFWISTELDNIAAEINPADPGSVELHDSPMFGGKNMWRKIPKETRVELIKRALGVLANAHVSNRVFGCVINKAAISPNDPVEFAFEQLSSRFDQYLLSLHRANDSQRGLIIFDKSTYETTIQNLAADFRTNGHTWGVLRNFAEVPLFIDSRASRLIQLADLVAYAIFRNYEFGDNQFYSIIEHRIDSAGGLRHGLYERL